MRKRWLIFVALAMIGIGLRLWACSQGHNYDIDSWDIVARLVLQGKSVYANTFRYPYGPVGAYGLAGLQAIANLLGLDGIEGFHLVVASFLSLVDVFIAWIAFRVSGLGGAAMILLNPVSILITGFHSQIEPVAIALGILSWFLLRRALDLDSKRLFYVSAAVLGLSLCVKHLFIFFPLWVMMARGKFQWKMLPRLLYAGVAYAAFLLSFVAYCLAYPESLHGVVHNVFLYRGLGFFGNSLVPRLLARIAFIGRPIAQSPLAGLLTPTWVVLMLGLGWLSRDKWVRLPYLYLVCLLMFTPSIADQYLLDIVVVTAIFWRWWQSWLFTAVATVYLTFSGDNVGGLIYGFAEGIADTPWHFLNDRAGPQLALIPLLWKLMTAPETDQDSASPLAVQTATIDLPSR